MKLPQPFRKSESRLPNAHIFASALKRTPNSQRRLLLKADDEKENNCSSPPEAVPTAAGSGSRSGSPLVLRVSAAEMRTSKTTTNAMTSNKKNKHTESMDVNDEQTAKCNGHCTATKMADNEENNKNRLNNIHCQCNNKAAISPTANG